MGKTFDSVMVKDEDSVPDTGALSVSRLSLHAQILSLVLKEGVMSADERKAFILAQVSSA